MTGATTELIRFVEGDLEDPHVVALLRTHVDRAIAETARGSAHALDFSALKGAEIRFWSLWQGEHLAAIGALRRLDARQGEIKSMHVAEALRGCGHGAAMVRHITDAARDMGLARLSLETGAWDYFIPARALYARCGFSECGPFGDYADDPNSCFFTRALNRADP